MSTPASTLGGGSNALRGRRLETLVSYHAPQRTPFSVLGHGSTRFCTTPHATTRSARTSGVRGSSSRRRRSAVVRSNGTFATTRNGSRGSGTRVASPTTTSTFGQRSWRAAARLGSSSTATTRRAARASSAVRRPVPAPRSTTRSSGPTHASRTSSAGRAPVRRKCWLRARVGRALRARRPATEERHCHRRVASVPMIRGREADSHPRRAGRALDARARRRRTADPDAMDRGRRDDLRGARPQPLGDRAPPHPRAGRALLQPRPHRADRIAARALRHGRRLRRRERPAGVPARRDRARRAHTAAGTRARSGVHPRGSPLRRCAAELGAFASPCACARRDHGSRPRVARRRRLRRVRPCGQGELQPGRFAAIRPLPRRRRRAARRRRAGVCRRSLGNRLLQGPPGPARLSGRRRRAHARARRRGRSLRVALRRPPRRARPARTRAGALPRARALARPRCAAHANLRVARRARRGRARTRPAAREARAQGGVAGRLLARAGLGAGQLRRRSLGLRGSRGARVRTASAHRARRHGRRARARLRRDLAYSYDGEPHWNAVWEYVFWNRRIRHVYWLDGTKRVPGPLPQQPVAPASDGVLAQDAPPFLLASTAFTFFGTPVTAIQQSGLVQRGLVLWQIEPPLRLSTVLTGVQGSGDIYGPARMTAYACTEGAFALTLVAKGAHVTVTLQSGANRAEHTLAAEEVWSPTVPAATQDGRCVLDLTPTGLVGSTKFEFSRR